jgi:flagellar basal-body rod protein FlgG
MLGQWQRHEVLANNLANVSTAGFKADDLTLVPRQPIGPSAVAGPTAGAWAVVQWTDFSQGPLRETGRTLDVALNGPGFFVVQTPRGVRYTRAGAFELSADGRLVTRQGFPVLGERGSIVLGSDRVRIGPGGELHQDGRRLDTLRVVDFPKPYRLLKEGDGLFSVADPAGVPELARGYEVVGGALEGSNVNPVAMMVNMIDLLRRYEAAQRVIQAVDETARWATNEIGRG